MHEAGLDIGANQNAEPDQVDAEPVRNRSKQRNDNECNLEKIQKERDYKNENIDEDQESDLTARQRGQQILDPDLASHTLEYKAERARTDKDEDHHGGDAHRRRHALIKELPGEGAV